MQANFIGYSPLRQKGKLLNVANITNNSVDHGTPSYKTSLNYINRKNEQARQIEDNIQMLKKIHYAEPTVKNSDLKKNEKKQK